MKNILDSVTNFFTNKENTDIPSAINSEVKGYGNYSYNNKNKGEFLNSMKGWVYTAVDSIANELGAIKIRLFELQRNGDVKEILDHKALDILHKVNSFTTKFDFFWLTQCYLELVGECYWLIEKDVSGCPINLYQIRPDRITPITTEEKIISGYTIKLPNGKETTLEYDDIIFLNNPDPISIFTGLGTLQAAALTVDIDNESEKWNYNFYKNSARPDMVLTVKDANQMSKEQKTALKTSIRELHEGTKKSHKAMVLFGNMEIEKFGFNQKDMDFTEQMKFGRDKILGMFRVPKAIVAQTEGVNFASAKAAQYIFDRYTVNPKMEKLVQQLNEFYLPLFENSETMYFDFISPIKDDQEMLLKKYDSGLASGWLTVNEVRSFEGLKPLGKFDTPYLPANLVPTGTPTKNLERIKELNGRSRNIINFNKKTDKVKDKIKNIVRNEINNSKKVKKVKPIKKEDDVNKEHIQFWETKNKVFQDFLKPIENSQLKIFKEQEIKTLAKLDKQKKYNIKKESLTPTKVKNLKIEKILLDPQVELGISLDLQLPILTELFVDSANKTSELLGVTNRITGEEELVEKFLLDETEFLINGVTKTTNSEILKELTIGLENGEGVKDLNTRIKTVFKKATNTRAELISRTETARYNTNASNLAMKQSGVVKAKQWQVDSNPCPQCAELQGKIVGLDDNFLKKGDEINGIVFDYSNTINPPLHPNSVWDGGSLVFTPKGNKRIMDVEINDLVLSHTGKFRRVFATPRKKKTGKKYKIYVKGQNISVTGEHLIMSSKGWQRADKLVAGDMIQMHFDKCECGNKKLVYKTCCGKDCEYYYKNITEKAQIETRKIVKLGKHPFQNKKVREIIRKVTNTAEHRKNSSERMKKNNPSKISEVRKRMTESYKKTMLENPKRHPNYIMAQKGFVSNLEKEMMEILDNLNIKYDRQYPVKQYFPDFKIKGHNILIECDGEYWHGSEEAKIKDAIRQKEIENEGFIMLRFPASKTYNKEDVSKQILKVLANHDGKFKGSFYKIDRINTTNVHKAKMTYDLTIDKDESFVLNGIAVHNCQCDIVPVLTEI